MSALLLFNPMLWLQRARDAQQIAWLTRIEIALAVVSIAAPDRDGLGRLGRAFTAQSDAVWLISAGVVAGEVAAGRLVRRPWPPA